MCKRFYKVKLVLYYDFRNKALSDRKSMMEPLKSLENSKSHAYDWNRLRKFLKVKFLY